MGSCNSWLHLFFLILIFKACYIHGCTWAHTQAQAYQAHTFLLGPVLLTASNHKSQVKQLHLKCIMNYALSLRRAEKTYSNLFLIAWGHHYRQQVYAGITQWGFLGMQGSLSLYQMVSEMMVFESPASSLCFFFSDSPITINLLDSNGFLSNFLLLI